MPAEVPVSLQGYRGWVVLVVSAVVTVPLGPRRKDVRSLGIIHHCSVFRLVAAVACPLVISHVPSATFPHQPTSLQGAFYQEYAQLLYLGCGGTLGPQRLSQGYLRRCPGFHFYRTWCLFLA